MPSRARTSGSSSKTAGTRVTRSLWPAASIRRAASARASGSRSRPITRSPGVGVEHRERVAGQAEGGVDEDGAVGGAGGGEEFGDALEEDGHVHRWPQGAGAAALRAAHRHCLSNGPGPPCDGAARGGPGCGTQGFRWSGGRGVGPRAWWGGVGEAFGLGGGGAGWGKWSGVGWVEPSGARIRERVVARPPRVPPGVGEERQVASRGGGVGSPRPACVSAAAPAVGVRDRAAGKAAGARPGRAAGKAARTGCARRPGCSGRRPGGRPWDHDNVGIPSLSISAYIASCSAT